MSRSTSTGPRDARGARTLPGRYYRSPEIYAREIERIFLRRWVCAGRSAALVEPGEYFLFDVGGESVIVLRDGTGTLRAFHNLCRHRGTRLLIEERGQLGKHLRCVYHAWTYGLDGTLAGAPNMNEVPDFRREEYPLLPVRLAEWEGFVLLNLDPAAVPFEETWAPMIAKFGAWTMPGLDVAHTIEYDVRANWKLVFQNYSECYHCPSLHPQLNRLTPFRDSANDLEEGPFLGGPMRLAREDGSMTMTGARCAAPLPGVAGQDRRLVYYYTIFPAMLLSLHPDYVLVHRVEPLAPDRTRIVCDWLFHPEAIAAPGFDPRDAVEFWNVTNRQDWDVSERSQKGVASRFYVPGPYAQLESMIAAFDREYLAALGTAAETEA